MGFLVYLLMFWGLSWLYHEKLASKAHRTRRKMKYTAKMIKEKLNWDRDVMRSKDYDTLQELHDEALKLYAKGTPVEEREEFYERANKVFGSIYKSKNKVEDNVKSLLEMAIVVLSVVMTIRAHYFQPFKIPTGSMQATLYGIHIHNDKVPHETQGFFKKFIEYTWFGRRHFYYEISPENQDKELEITGQSITKSRSFFFSTLHAIIGTQKVLLPGEPREYISQFQMSAQGPMMFKQNRVNAINLEKSYVNKGIYLKDGEEGRTLKGYHVTGDHLFVDRLTFNIRDPKRGDIVVFITKNIKDSDGLPLMGYHYIKRLVGLPGDSIRLKSNGVLEYKPQGEEEFRDISEDYDVFKKIFSNKGGYHGYSFGDEYLRFAGDEYIVPENSYFCMGDNSNNSKDCRNFGSIPRENIIGRAIFVWWPVSRRWGFVDTKEALNEPTN